MTKFTPGPWKYCPSPLSTEIHDKDNKFTICKMCFQPDEIANAKLISIAPEMYEFMKDVIEVFTTNDLNKMPNLILAIQTAKELIKKID